MVTGLEVLGDGLVVLVGAGLAVFVGAGLAVLVVVGVGDGVPVAVDDGDGVGVPVGVDDGAGDVVLVGVADGDGAADVADGDGLGAGELLAGVIRATVDAVTAAPDCPPARAPPGPTAATAAAAPHEQATAAVTAPITVRARTALPERAGRGVLPGATDIRPPWLDYPDIEQE